jgi:hypothetical protein
MEATVRRELITAILATLLGCNPVFAQVGGIGSPSPGMGLTSPFGMSSAAGSVGPTGLPLGATELAAPGLSPAPPSTFGSGLTICSAVVGAGSSSATGTFDGGGVGSSAGMPQTAMGETNSASAGACNQASGAGSAGTLQSTTPSPGSTAPLGIGTIPLGSTELGNAGVSPTPCPLTGPTLPTDGSVTATGAC